MARGSSMATWLRPRSLRTGRSIRNRQETDADEIVQLDLTKDTSVSLKEILYNVVKKDGVSKGRKPGYLNCFVKLCENTSNDDDLGLSKDEIFCCLRVALIHDAKEVRAAGLRAIRYFLNDESAADAFLRVQMQHLVVRSLDVVLDNHVERVQALRLVRKFLHVCPEKFPSAFTRCLVAIANDGAVERDRLLRVCLATLSELALHNSEHCLEMGGVRALLHNTLDCQMPRINEALVGTVICLLNCPKTRALVRDNINLEQILAPFTDYHYYHSVETSEFSSSDDKESRFLAGRLAVLSALRSWPGMVYLCKPGESGITSLVKVLHLPYADIRKGTVDIFFELFCLVVPEWSDNFFVALESANPSTLQDSWKLYEGFVADEGRLLLPHLAKYRSNLVENYLALLLLTLLHAGLFEALVEVIITSEAELSIRTTVLLGELLHLASHLLPRDCSHHSHCLPTLIAKASSFHVEPLMRHRASTAVTYLNTIHSLKKRCPQPCSLFLNQLVTLSPRVASESLSSSSLKTGSVWMRKNMKRDAEDMQSLFVKDTMVLSPNSDPSRWDWSLIGAILKLSGDSLKKMEDSNCRAFLRRLIHFYKPTSKQFSAVELAHPVSRQVTLVGCLLMDFLLDSDEVDGSKLLDELLTNFGLCLSQVSTERCSLDALFSPNKVMTTCCQYYFLFVGRLCRSSRGRKALERNNVFQYLMDLVSVTSHDCYIKLIASSLDYSVDGFSRVILIKILTATGDTSRLYATQFLRVLVRLRIPDFPKFGIEMLITQVYDKSRAVSLAALEILDEACEDERNLEAMILLRPSLLHLGDRGMLLVVRFLSLPNGFKFLNDANFTLNELERWRKTYSLKYVSLVESELNDALTRHQRDEDGSYGRRSSQRHVVRDVYVPHHIYGQLVQHEAGFELLLDQNCLTPHIQIILDCELDSMEHILQLKAAIWALGHAGTSERGLGFLSVKGVIPEIVKLAEKCPVLSVRGTCFYVLGLLSTTSLGADMLSMYGWESVRHSRDELWPVINPYYAASRELEDSESFSGSVGSRSVDVELETVGCSPSPELRPRFELASDDVDDNVEEAKIESDESLDHLAPSQETAPTGMFCQRGNSWKRRNGVWAMAGVTGLRSHTLPACKNHQVTCRQRSLSVTQPSPEMVTSAIRDGCHRGRSYTEPLGHREIDLCDGFDVASRDQHVKTRLSYLPRRPVNSVLQDETAHVLASSLPHQTEHSSLVFTSSRDAHGYAMLRNLQRRRRVTATCVTPDPGLMLLVQDDRAAKARSLDSRLDSKFFSQVDRHPSAITATTTAAGALSPGVDPEVPSRYVGLCIPLNTAAIFTIDDRDAEKRSTAAESDTAKSDCSPDSWHPHHVRDPSFDESSGSALKLHTTILCLGCFALRLKSPITTTVDTVPPVPSFRHDEDVGATVERLLAGTFIKDSPRAPRRFSRMRLESADVSGSMSTVKSSDSMTSMEKQVPDGLGGQELIRKEILRFVINLSSSVAVRSAEQGLLNLKQKFPKTFQDLCLYTEVCLMMAMYSFRLSARRFIQELFWDLDFDKLLEEPFALLANHGT